MKRGMPSLKSLAARSDRTPSPPILLNKISYSPRYVESPAGARLPLEAAEWLFCGCFWPDMESHEANKCVLFAEALMTPLIPTALGRNRQRRKRREREEGRGPFSLFDLFTP